MPAMPLETIRGARFGASDHGYSYGQGDPASTSGMAVLPVPGPPGPDHGENEELKAVGQGASGHGVGQRLPGGK
jgi:hypothetical protein